MAKEIVRNRSGTSLAFGSPAGKTAIVVLGMHRSGTSSLSGSLCRLGCKEPTSLIPASDDNERGYYESLKIRDLNDAVLASAGSAWDDWRVFSESWISSPVATVFEEQACATIVQEYGLAQLIVVKDPRMCRMMPFWTRALNRAGYAIRCILLVRSPLEVASSLWLRDEFPIDKSLLLWLRHVLDAEAITRDLPRAVLHWPDFLDDWRLALTHAGEQISVSWPRLADQSASEIDHFLSPSLRHNVTTKEALVVDPYVNEWVRETYLAMVNLAAEPASINAWRALDEIRSEFSKACKIFGRALTDFEENLSRSQADVANTRSECERLAVEVVENQRHADTLVMEREVIANERNALRERLITAIEERNAVRAQLAALVGESDALTEQLASCNNELSKMMKVATNSRAALTFSRRTAVPAWKRVIGAGYRSIMPIPRQVSALRSTGKFHTKWYLSTYSDVSAAGMDPIEHYLRHGFSEGRFPHPLFDTLWYLQTYSDVLASGMNPFLHYIFHGWREGRSPNAFLNTGWYLANYHFVDIDPMMHYFTIGASDFLDPSSQFSTTAYVKRHENVDFSTINPLSHFLHEEKGKEPA